MDPTGTADLMGFFRGRKILVVEDEYFLAKEISVNLTKAGATVVGPFPDVGEALAEVSAVRALDAALLDVNLRAEMIFPVAAALRERGTPFVFMTGYDRSSLPIAYRDVPICEKPVNIADFARLLAASPRQL